MSFDLKIVGGDLEFDSTGNPSRVFDTDKLKQDLVKILLTPLGSNKTHPWYGSPMSDRVIGKILDPNILQIEVKSAVAYAINNLIELQKLQIKDGQYLSPGESISKILGIDVETSVYDARQFNIIISVATRRGDVVRESFTLTT